MVIAEAVVEDEEDLVRNEKSTDPELDELENNMLATAEEMLLIAMAGECPGPV